MCSPLYLLIEGNCYDYYRARKLLVGCTFLYLIAVVPALFSVAVDLPVRASLNNVSSFRDPVVGRAYYQRGSSIFAKLVYKSSANMSFCLFSILSFYNDK